MRFPTSNVLEQLTHTVPIKGQEDTTLMLEMTEVGDDGMNLISLVTKIVKLVVLCYSCDSKKSYEFAIEAIEELDECYKEGDRLPPIALLELKNDKDYERAITLQYGEKARNDIN